jgi:hypothetical protein
MPHTKSWFVCAASLTSTPPSPAKKAILKRVALFWRSWRLSEMSAIHHCKVMNNKLGVLFLWAQL